MLARISVVPRTPVGGRTVASQRVAPQVSLPRQVVAGSSRERYGQSDDGLINGPPRRRVSTRAKPVVSTAGDAAPEAASAVRAALGNLNSNELAFLGACMAAPVLAALIVGELTKRLAPRWAKSLTDVAGQRPRWMRVFPTGLLPVANLVAHACNGAAIFCLIHAGGGTERFLYEIYAIGAISVGMCVRIPLFLASRSTAFLSLMSAAIAFGTCWTISMVLPESKPAAWMLLPALGYVLYSMAYHAWLAKRSFEMSAEGRRGERGGGAATA